MARAERARLVVLVVSTAVWLVLAGVYSLGVVVVSASDHVCYRATPRDAVEVSWVPLGYACRHVGPDGHQDVDLAAGEVRVDGPGPITGALQVFLLGFPVVAWITAGRMDEPTRRRRELAEAGVIGGFGLATVGITALVVESPGVASVLLVSGCSLGAVAAVSRHRTTSHLQHESSVPR